MGGYPNFSHDAVRMPITRKMQSGHSSAVCVLDYCMQECKVYLIVCEQIVTRNRSFSALREEEKHPKEGPFMLCFLNYSRYRYSVCLILLERAYFR